MISLNDLPTNIKSFTDDVTNKLNIENISNTIKGLLNITNPLDQFLKCKDGSNLNLRKCLNLLGLSNFEICQDIQNNGQDAVSSLGLVETIRDSLDNISEFIESIEYIECDENADGIASDIIALLTGIASDLSSNGSSFIECIFNINLKENLKNLLNKVISIIENITDLFKKGIFSSLFNKVKEFLLNIVSDIENILIDIINDLYNYYSILKSLIECILNIGGRVFPTSNLRSYDNPISTKPLTGNIRGGFTPIGRNIPSIRGLSSLFN